MANDSTKPSALTLSRRDFIRTTGTVALAVSLGACSSDSSLSQAADGGPTGNMQPEPPTNMVEGRHSWRFDTAEYTEQDGVHLWEIRATDSRVWMIEGTQRVRIESGCVHDSGFLWEAITPSRISDCIAQTMPNDWDAITGGASRLLGDVPIYAARPV